MITRPRRLWLSLLGALPFLSLVFCAGMAFGLLLSGGVIADFLNASHVVCQVN